MSNVITANDLKTGGISAIQKIISRDSEAIITVRGKSRFVILDMEQYNRLRDCELEAALLESRKDVKEGRFTEESVENHIKRIING